MNNTTPLVLVTGASGFVGSHLVEHLASSTRVVAWTRSQPPGELAPVARWQTIDLLNRELVRAAIADLRPARIYHCAGVPHVAESWRDTAQPLAGNVLATEHLLDAVRRAGGPCRILVPGSATVYAPSSEPISESHLVAPSSPYAISKLAQEQLALRAIEEDGSEVIVTRSFNHTGPRQTPAFVAPSMARQIALIEKGHAPPVIKVGNLETTRDLMDVRDVVQAYVALMERGVPGTIYNVASGIGRSMRSVLDALLARSTAAVNVEVDATRMRPNDIPIVVGNSSRLTAATGWRPAVSFERMLDDLLAHWRAQVEKWKGGKVEK